MRTHFHWSMHGLCAVLDHVFKFVIVRTFAIRFIHKAVAGSGVALPFAGIMRLLTFVYVPFLSLDGIKGL